MFSPVFCISGVWAPGETWFDHAPTASGLGFYGVIGCPWQIITIIIIIIDLFTAKKLLNVLIIYELVFIIILIL